MNSYSFTHWCTDDYLERCGIVDSDTLKSRTQFQVVLLKAALAGCSSSCLVWSVWILHPAVRQVLTAPPPHPCTLFSGFATERLLYMSSPRTHINPAIVCVCLARRPACQWDGSLPGLMLTDSHFTPVSGIFWMTLAVFQTFTAVSRNE